MGLFKKKHYNAIGLDIGHSSVKGIEIAAANGAMTVNRFGSVPILEKPDSSNRAQAVVEAIQKLQDQVGFSTRKVVTAVSGESVIVRVLRLPYFDEKETDELDFAVQSEARDFIPFDMDDVAFDYQRLGVLDLGSEGKSLEVLIVAAQKDLVNWLAEVIRASGLDPRVIDIGSFALVNAVYHGANMAPDTPVALVDIGSAVTNIAIMRGETTRFTRDLSTAGGTITRAIMSELGLDLQEAEQAKIEHGIAYEVESGGSQEILTLSQSNLPEMFDEMGSEPTAPSSEPKGIEEQVNGICEQFLGEIVSEIKRCLLFYENQLDGQPVEKVFLTGGTVRMKNADLYIGNLLDTPTEVLDPFKNITGEISSLDPLERSSTYTVGLGLAMRSALGRGIS